MSPWINEAQIKRIFYHSKRPSRKSIKNDMHHERAGRMETKKYLRKSCCHRIECPVTNFLVAFMWRRPMNSVALATTTHRRSERVSDGTDTQVVTQITNK